MNFIRSFISAFRKPLSRDEKIITLMTVVSFGFFASVIFFYFQGMYFNKPFPDNTFLPGPVTRFGDFYGIIGPWVTEGQFNATGLGQSYFPGMYIIADLFARVFKIAPRGSLILLGIIFVYSLMAYAFMQLKSDRKGETFLRAFICTMMTYPVLFTLQTSNLQGLVFLFICLFVELHRRGKTRLGIIALAMAISMKLFPAIYLVLLVADKKYKEVFITIGWTAFFSILPLAVFYPGMHGGLHGYLERLQASQKMYVDLMILSGAGNNFGHSFINSAWLLMGGNFPPIAEIAKPYMLFALGFFAVVASYIVLVEQVLWKKLTLIIACLCLLPYTSTDYKLLDFFIPLFLFINHQSEEKHSPDMVYMLLLSLIMIPKNYYSLGALAYASSNNVLNTFCMLMLLIIIIVSGMRRNGWERGVSEAKNRLRLLRRH